MQGRWLRVAIGVGKPLLMPLSGDHSPAVGEPRGQLTVQPRYSRAREVSSTNVEASSSLAKTYGPGRIGSTRRLLTGYTSQCTTTWSSERSRRGGATWRPSFRALFN